LRILEGSCQSGWLKCIVESDTPYPFSRCYFSICRKLAGGSGSAINIIANKLTLKVSREEHLSVYRSNLNDRDVYEKDGLGYSHRDFCKDCGTMTRNHNSRHGQWVYLLASSADRPLPPPPEERHTMTNYKASWVNIPENDSEYDQYPDQSIEDWHKKRGLLGPF
tara:strand:+ start:78 stop:572 length:495 start_codon:yes stop_codon:yes gene_type:complete